MQHNRIENPNWQEATGYLQAWPMIWTQDNQEQIQQVARAGLKPGTTGLQVPRIWTQDNQNKPSKWPEQDSKIASLTRWPLKKGKRNTLVVISMILVEICQKGLKVCSVLYSLRLLMPLMSEN